MQPHFLEFSRISARLRAIIRVRQTQSRVCASRIEAESRSKKRRAASPKGGKRQRPGTDCMLPALRQNIISARFHTEQRIFASSRCTGIADRFDGRQRICRPGNTLALRRSSTDERESLVDGRFAGGLIFLPETRLTAPAASGIVGENRTGGEQRCIGKSAFSAPETASLRRFCRTLSTRGRAKRRCCGKFKTHERPAGPKRKKSGKPLFSFIHMLFICDAAARRFITGKSAHPAFPRRSAARRGRGFSFCSAPGSAGRPPDRGRPKERAGPS